MSFLNKIFNFIKNIYRLCKIATLNNDLKWKMLEGSKGDGCDINANAKITLPYEIKNSSVGKGSYISSNANISYTSIGRFCSIGPNFISGWGIHPLNGVSTSPVFYSTLNQLGLTYSKTNKIEERKPVKIGNDVFIGANVIILDGVTIGDGAVIGAGAVVSKNIPPYAIAVGCPIKITRYRFPENVINDLLTIRWWDQEDEMLKNVEKYFFDMPNFIKYARKFDDFNGDKEHSR